MTCVDDVRRASSPQEALLAIAKHIDLLTLRLHEVQQPADAGWGSWGASAPSAAHGRGQVAQPGSRQAGAEASHETQSDLAEANRRREQANVIRAQMAQTADPQELEALSARLRLLLDDGRPMGMPVIPDGERAQIVSDGEQGEVALPAPDEETEAERFAWAMNHQLHTFLTGSGLDAEQAALAYSKGGPMWLYLGNRDAVMAMPPHWRQELIDDLQRFSPADAYEMARDVLKDASPDGNKGIVTQHIQRMSDRHG